MFYRVSHFDVIFRVFVKSVDGLRRSHFQLLKQTVQARILTVTNTVSYGVIDEKNEEDKPKHQQP